MAIWKWFLFSSYDADPPPELIAAYKGLFNIVAFVVTIATVIVCALAVLRVAGLG